MNMKNSPDGTIRGALRYPAFRALLAGLAVSQAGDWLYNIALVTLVYQRTGSAMWPASPPPPGSSRWSSSGRSAASSRTVSTGGA